MEEYYPRRKEGQSETVVDASGADWQLYAEEYNRENAKFLVADKAYKDKRQSELDGTVVSHDA